MSGRFGRLAHDADLRGVSRRLAELGEKIESARVAGDWKLLERLMSERKKLLDAAVERRGDDSETQVAGAQRSGGDLANDPPVSERQRRAMHAAARGKSTLGIPKKVGREFVGA